MQSVHVKSCVFGVRCRLPSGMAAVVSLSLVLAGCAAEPKPYRVAGPVRDAPPNSIRVEIEDDGLPAQIAPRHRRAMPDDPSEPWSPNYGSAPPAKFDAAKVSAKLDSVEKSQPAAPVKSAHASRIDADEVIRQAIAAHEMRRN
jgi:hypothetical protein